MNIKLGILDIKNKYGFECRNGARRIILACQLRKQQNKKTYKTTHRQDSSVLIRKRGGGGRRGSRGIHGN